jgi:hypothetical protein
MSKKHKFIEIAELTFAFFMTASLYSALDQICQLTVRNTSSLATSLLKFLLCSLILIRFFFAPTSNIECMLLYTRKTLWRKLSILLWDFPVLIFHATFFYLICNSLWNAKNWLVPLKDFTPFFWFLCLLTINFIWLITISMRLWYWSKRKKRFFRFNVWIYNNLFFSIYLTLVIINEVKGQLALLMIGGFLNCFIDIYFTASDYLEQRDS